MAPHKSAHQASPLRSFIQAKFFEEGFSEKFGRFFWPKDADSKIRTELLESRRKTLLFKIIGRDAQVEYGTTKRTHLLRQLVELRLLITELKSLSVNPPSQKDRIKNRDYAQGLQTSVVRSIKAEKKWCDDELDIVGTISHQLALAETEWMRARMALASMRQNLVEARAESDAMSPSDISVTYKTIQVYPAPSNGSGMHLRCSLKAFAPEAVRIWGVEFWIEILPALGDDLDAILRKMNRQRKAANGEHGIEHRFVAVVGRYEGEGISFDQVRQIFRAARIDIVSLDELGIKTPLLPLKSDLLAQGSLFAMSS